MSPKKNCNNFNYFTGAFITKCDSEQYESLWVNINSSHSLHSCIMSFSIVTLTALIRFILVSCASVVTLTALIRFILLSCVLILLVLVVDIPEQVSPEPLGPKNVHR